MIKEFDYTSPKGIRHRKVFVIKENENYIAGLDLTLLSQEDCDTIMSMYKDVKPISDFKSKITLENFNPDWNRAYRQFTKSHICSFK